jgi:hypothetical protein
LLSGDNLSFSQEVPDVLGFLADVFHGECVGLFLKLSSKRT